MTDTAPLFEPFTCRGMTIANRIAMAPMTRSFSPGGVPTEEVAEYYARRAAADVGLLITEGTTVDRGGRQTIRACPTFIRKPRSRAGSELLTVSTMRAARSPRSSGMWA